MDPGIDPVQPDQSQDPSTLQQVPRRGGDDVTVIDATKVSELNDNRGADWCRCGLTAQGERTASCSLGRRAEVRL
jgi:hypothetical protein